MVSKSDILDWYCWIVEDHLNGLSYANFIELIQTFLQEINWIRIYQCYARRGVGSTSSRFVSPRSLPHTSTGEWYRFPKTAGGRAGKWWGFIELPCPREVFWSLRLSRGEFLTTDYDFLTTNYIVIIWFHRGDFDINWSYFLGLGVDWILTILEVGLSSTGIDRRIIIIILIIFLFSF